MENLVSILLIPEVAVKNLGHLVAAQYADAPSVTGSLTTAN